MGWKWLGASILLLLFGIKLILGDAATRKQHDELADRGVRTQGRVDWSKYRGGWRENKSYQIEVKFFDEGAEEHTLSRSVRKKFYEQQIETLPEAERFVTIVYDPADVYGTAYVDGTKRGDSSSVGYLALLIGIAGIAIGLFRRPTVWTEQQ